MYIFMYIYVFGSEKLHASFFMRIVFICMMFSRDELWILACQCTAWMQTRKTKFKGVQALQICGQGWKNISQNASPMLNFFDLFQCKCQLNCITHIKVLFCMLQCTQCNVSAVKTILKWGTESETVMFDIAITTTRDKNNLQQFNLWSIIQSTTQLP